MCLAKIRLSLLDRTHVAQQGRDVRVCAIRAVESGRSRRLTWGAQYLRAVKTIVLSVRNIERDIPAAIYNSKGSGN